MLLWQNREWNSSDRVVRGHFLRTQIFFRDLASLQITREEISKQRGKKRKEFVRNLC